jgi:O-antigen/teichoic acid export membrane protein
MAAVTLAPITSGTLERGAPPRAALSLRANFSWTFIGNVVYAGCQWAMLVVLAKLGSPELVGRFALGFAVTAPVVMLTNLQLRGVQATDARQEHRFGEYLALRLVAVPLALAIVAAITILSRYGWETTLVVLAVGLAKTFESVSDVFYGLLQQHERMDRIAKSMLLKGPLSLVALGVVVYLTGNVLWATLALAAVWALLLLAYDVPNGARVLRFALQAGMETQETLRPVWNPRNLARLARLALPLGIVMMLGSLTTNIPRYFIAHYNGAAELGIFAAMGYILIAGTTVVDALGQSASPRLAKLYAAGDTVGFRALVVKLLGSGVALGVVGLALGATMGRRALTLMYRPEYAAHLNVFLWLLVAAGIGYLCSFVGYSVTAARYFAIQVPIFVVSIVVNLAACAVLIPRYGLIGAAWALCIMLAAQLPMKGAAILYALRKGQ